MLQIPMLQVNDLVPLVDPASVISQFLAAVSGGHWALVVGCVLCMVVWVIRRFVWKNVSPKVLPWLALVIGACGCAGFSLLASPEAWLTALVLGVNGGLTAAGVWGLLKVARE